MDKCCGKNLNKSIFIAKIEIKYVALYDYIFYDPLLVYHYDALIGTVKNLISDIFFNVFNSLVFKINIKKMSLDNH